MWLDHVSVAVPDLAAAVEQLDRRLGLRATVSADAPERHSRIHLHRSYLEVSTGSSDDRWEATMFFLRFDDPHALRARLASAGITFRFAEYRGVDGTWDDVEVRLGDAPLPTLIRRTAPLDVAADWPPALEEPHRSGAYTLAAVHVEVPSLDDAIDAYRRLLASADPVVERARLGRVPLDSGEVELHEREGAVGRIDGIVLSVPSIDRTRASIDARLEPPVHGVAWVHPEDVFGLRLGFAEVAGGPADA